jgi:5-methylcytosine-specific restriction endonuclease McrBC regulatory subunit McrC
LPLERLFERYLTRAVQEAFAGRPNCLVQVQEPFALAESAPGQPDVQIRPDVTVRQDGKATLVVDAKWKRLGRAAVVTEDVYQVLSYCLALGAPTAVLVYPGRRQRVWEYVVGQACARVQVRTLDVAGTPEQCARGRRRLGRYLRAARQ